MNLNIPTTCQIPNLRDLYAKWLPMPTGSFVEIGAFDGVTYSNTSCLAEIGWKGLYVEPHPELVKCCRKNYAGNTNIVVEEVAVGNTTGRVKLYERGEVSSLLLDQNSRDWGCTENVFVEVECVRMDALLEKHAGFIQPFFDLLVIDVEGAEVQVLESFTLSRWMPKMVIIEAHEQDQAVIRNWKADPINKYFTSSGYFKVQADHINSIFISNQHWSHDSAVLGT